MNWCPIQSVLLSYTRFTQGRLWIHPDPDQNKALIEHEYLTIIIL